MKPLPNKDDVMYLFSTLVKVMEEMKKALAKDLESVDKRVDNVDNKAEEAIKIAEETQKMEGPKGEKGEDATVDYPYIIAQIPPPIKGDKGDTVVVEKEIVIEKTEVIKEQPIVTNQIVKETVQTFDATEIEKEIEELKKMIEDIKKIPRGGVFGGRAGIQILGAGVKVGTKANEINFGTGLTTTDVNGRITVTATGGGTGFTKETPAGAVDASNTVFTVTVEPNYVIADGITFFDGQGYTYGALTITMTNPPAQYIRSYY